MEEVDEDEGEESEETAEADSEEEAKDEAGEPLDGVAKGEESTYLAGVSPKATDE